jgi:tetratricopeptide (TPR) repeat protein
MRPTALRLPALVACACALAACQSFEGPPLGPDLLVEPRALHEEGRHEEAWELLDEHEAENFDLAAQREFNLLAGQVCDAMGEWDRAVRFFEAAMAQPGPASEALQVEQRLLELGIELLEGKRRVLIFFTDRGRGVVTLENLAFAGQFRATRAEALARLAEYHYQRTSYADAALFYAGLLDPALAGLGYEDQASFRLGMCSVKRVDPERLNGTLLLQGLDQFRAYLRDFPSGLHHAEAVAESARMRELYGEYQLMLADYYRTIGNPAGERHHLRIAAGEELAGVRELAPYLQGTAAAATAAERLAALPPEADEAR